MQPHERYYVSTIALDLQTDVVILPPPQLPPQASLVHALSHRASSRAFSSEPVSAEWLSALLWAAFGVNRPSTHGRTAPSAHNWQEMDLFVVLPQGAYRYDAHSHRLELVKAEDLREATGTQDYVQSAPVQLVYVANTDLATGVTSEERTFLIGVDAGCIAQNASLLCASAGLNTVVRGLINRRLLAGKLGLKTTQRIALAQSVGWPVGVE